MSSFSGPCAGIMEAMRTFISLDGKTLGQGQGQLVSYECMKCDKPRDIALEYFKRYGIYVGQSSWHCQTHGFEFAKLTYSLLKCAIRHNLKVENLFHKVIHPIGEIEAALDDSESWTMLNDMRCTYVVIPSLDNAERRALNIRCYCEPQ